jgi:hypothetical protein
VGTGASITLEAFRYRETNHTLTLRALYNGTPQTAVIPFTVTAYRAADIVWTQTEDDSSLTNFDLASWTGWGDAVETWELSVVEQPLVYFAVHKRAGQTITAGGKDGALVTKADFKETVDGSTATETLDIFTVDTGDTLFAGGNRNFSLAVTEAGRTEAKIVTVNLTVRPRPTGIAIFYVGEGGRLTRLAADNAAHYANTYYRSHKDAGMFPAWGLDFAAVTDLKTAFAWLNNYAKGGTKNSWTEYLVRVEKDEALPKTTLHCYGGMPVPALAADYVRVRLRGYGGERLLTHDRTNSESPSFQKERNTGGPVSLSMGWGFLNVGLYSPGMDPSFYGLTNVALHLGENITVDAENGEDLNFPNFNGPNIRSMITVSKNAAFVMEPGSRLVRYRYNTSTQLIFSDFCPVTVYSGGVFDMRGGEMADIKNSLNLVYLQENDPTGFIYRFGTFTNCASAFIAMGNGRYVWPYDSTQFRPQD